MINLLSDNLSIGLYYRHIADDGTRTYMYFNRLMQEYFGCEYTPDSKYWAQEDDDNYDTIVMQTSEPFRIEFQLKDAERGINRWLVFIKQKAAAPKGQGGYLIFTSVIDITNRKAEELLLRRSKTNLQLAIQAGKMSTWDLDVATQKISITNGLDVTTPTISLEDHLLRRYYDKSQKQSHSDLLEVMSGKKVSGQGLYMMKDDKTGEILYRQSFFLAEKEKGKVTHVYGISQDVTETFRNREILRENMDELNLALDAGDLSAWIYDPAKKMFHALYGQVIAGDGLSLKDLLKILHPDDREKLVSYLNSLVSGKEIDSDYDYDFVFRFKDVNIPNAYRYYDSKMKGRLKDGKVVQIIGTQRDITEEIVRRKQLEEFNLKTNLINDATQSVFWDYDIERQVLLTYSDNALMPHQPISMEKYLSFIRLEERDYVREFFIKADNRALEEFSFEADLMLPGHDFYRRIVANGVPVRNEKGDIVKYTGVRKDISEIAQLNSELKDQNILKEVVVNNVMVGLILFSTDYKVIWANDYAATSFPEILHEGKCTKGTPCERLAKHKCTKNQGLCGLRAAIETGIKQEGERKYGKNGWVEVVCIPVFDENQKVARVLLKIRDITQAKRTLEELETSRKLAVEVSDYVSTLLDKMPAPIFIEDPDNDFRITKVNDAFCKLFHYSKFEAIGKSVVELFGEEVGRTHDLMLANGNYDGTITYEWNVVLDNQRYDYIVYKSMITNNHRHNILAVLSDITQVKKINEELAIAKEKALSADKLKTTFLANMSHEIRTPLNAIVGFSELLSATDNPDEKVEYSKIIYNSNQMLLRLISDILDLSKIESGTTEFQRESVNVSSYFNELTASLAIKCVNPDVKFIVDNPYQTCYINLDKMRFAQVVTNFVTNAIKYTRKGYIKVGYYIERHGITIRVEDTGVGIPADKRDRVFTRFDKLGSMAQGTGLGLPIAKILTETGGGKIWFESEEDKGSTFYSWKPFSDIRILKKTKEDGQIPEIPNPSKEKIKEPSSNPPHIIHKILVAEDNSSNFLLLKKILLNYEIDWAKDGVEAVEKVAKSRYDLVLMDIKMPIMDGLDATRQIRKFNSSIPIVAVTANAYAIDKDEALLAGCNDFLAKPILKEDVYSVLAKI